ncbi:MAG: low-specificity L-threonine aldolase [Anaerolineae bacterium]|nr:low-specificity L-threonine aldolase [Anaerolineae bacterium]
MIDLRSDTVTQPTPAMRKAMYEAELGDDVFAEDPTVNRLEELAAEKLGKEAALLVVSGTMGNLVSCLTHCQRGDEMILGDVAHIYLFEAGGVSALGGIHTRAVPNLPDGSLDPGDVLAAIRQPWNVHYPVSRLLALENTHNRCNGSAVPVEKMDVLGQLAHEHGLSVHLDGARIFNAQVALGVPASRIARECDSVQFCLSKGLSAPVGSVICGTRDFIREARRWRKVVGGGMRQAGVIAAAGVVALTEMIDRLSEDHANAKRLAHGLAQSPYIEIDPELYPTDIIYFTLGSKSPHDPTEFLSRLKERGVLVSQPGGTKFRAVTHYGITEADVDAAVAAISAAAAP